MKTIHQAQGPQGVSEQIKDKYISTKWQEHT